MKMAARVTVTAGRRGGVSAVSRGWQWQLSRCAGEEEDSVVIITYRTLKFLATHTQDIFSSGGGSIQIFIYVKVPLQHCNNTLIPVKLGDIQTLSIN